VLKIGQGEYFKRREYGKEKSIWLLPALHIGEPPPNHLSTVLPTGLAFSSPLFVMRPSRVSDAGHPGYNFIMYCFVCIHYMSCSTFPQYGYQARVAGSSLEFQLTQAQWHSFTYLYIPHICLLPYARYL
jgi:hypothetical protein